MSIKKIEFNQFLKVECPDSNYFLTDHSFSRKYVIPRYKSSELNLFKKQTLFDHSHKNFYSLYVYHFALYKAIFILFGFLFGFLGLTVFYKTGAWFSLFFFPVVTTIRGGLCFLCALLSFSGFFLGFMMSPELDIINLLVRRTRKALRQAHWLKQKSLMAEHWFYFWLSYKQNPDLRSQYLEACSKMECYKLESEHLMQRIKMNESIRESSKAQLYNQALAELHEKLSFTLSSFKSIPCR